MIEGISHITFVVKDLEKATLFFKHIFNGREVYSSGKSTFSIYPEKFFLINGLWIAIMEGESLEERSYHHIAFKIRESEFALYEKRILELGLDFRPSRPRVEGEGRSLYFYDFDNHLFELHTGTLSERLKRYGVNNYDNTKG